jgi:hypothetical protein
MWQKISFFTSYFDLIESLFFVTVNNLQKNILPKECSAWSILPIFYATITPKFLRQKCTNLKYNSRKNSRITYARNSRSYDVGKIDSW